MAKIVRVKIKGELLVWARERSTLLIEKLLEKFPDLIEWEEERKQPTVKQLQNFANYTRTPFGYLFLERPPDEKLPIPHYRTPKNEPIQRPSPDLLETVETMQQRQEWMRNYLVEEREDALPFVGSVTLNTGVPEVANSIRRVLGISTNWASQYDWWEQASHALREIVDNAGILVTQNGVVGNNNWRKLDIEEFRGFVLVDQRAPLIFINGADYPAAQLFTIAHELAHVWLGSGSAFNLLNLQPFDNDTEKFCDMVAAEFLVPRQEIQNLWREAEQQENPFRFLSRKFKVSAVVAARRALDLGFIDRDRFFEFYENNKKEWEEREKAKAEKLKKSKKQGGDFYNTQNVRIGKRFARSIYYAAKEGRILYRDAFRLTGLYGNTFDNYFKRLGIE